MARCAAWAACCLAGLAPASAHDWYTGLTSPTGETCCNGRDCQAVDERYDPQTQRHEIGIEGVWVPVDPAKLLSVPSPDGFPHACFERVWIGRQMTPIVRCIILPGEV